MMHKLLLAWSLLAIGSQGFRLQPKSVKSELDGEESRPKFQPYQALMPLLVALNPSPSNAFIVGTSTPSGPGSGGSTGGHAAVVSRGGTSEMIDRGSKVRVLRPGPYSQELGTVDTIVKGDHRHPVVVRFDTRIVEEFDLGDTDRLVIYADPATSNFALEELDEIDPPVAKAKKATRSGDPSMSAAGSDEQDEVVADAAAGVTRDGGKSVGGLVRGDAAAAMEEELEDAAAAVVDVIEDAHVASAGTDTPEAAAVANGGDNNAGAKTVQALPKAALALDWADAAYRSPWADRNPCTKDAAPASAGMDVPEAAAVAKGGDNNAGANTVQDLPKTVLDWEIRSPWADTLPSNPYAKSAAHSTGTDTPETGPGKR